MQIANHTILPPQTCVVTQRIDSSSLSHRKTAKQIIEFLRTHNKVPVEQSVGRRTCDLGVAGSTHSRTISFGTHCIYTVPKKTCDHVFDDKLK